MIVAGSAKRASVSMCPSVMSPPAIPSTHSMRSAPRLAASADATSCSLQPGFRLSLIQLLRAARSVPVPIGLESAALADHTCFHEIDTDDVCDQRREGRVSGMYLLPAPAVELHSNSSERSRLGSNEEWQCIACPEVIDRALDQLDIRPDKIASNRKVIRSNQHFDRLELGDSEPNVGDSALDIAKVATPHVAASPGSTSRSPRAGPPRRACVSRRRPPLSRHRLHRLSRRMPQDRARAARA